MPSPASTISRADVEAGQAVYSPRMLAIYDVLVHGISNHLVWRCATRKLRALFEQNVTNNHLDVGVGTGYFLDHCRFPSAHPRLALLDLNEHCLQAAAERVARYQPEKICANVLEPINYEGQQFDSISMMYLLHCLPGDMGTKRAALANVLPLLNSRGVLFGATLLASGVRPGWPARRLMSFYNRKQVFSNARDTLVGLNDALARHFGDYRVEVFGCAALFRAVKQ